MFYQIFSCLGNTFFPFIKRHSIEKSKLYRFLLYYSSVSKKMAERGCVGRPTITEKYHGKNHTAGHNLQKRITEKKKKRHLRDTSWLLVLKNTCIVVENISALAIIIRIIVECIIFTQDKTLRDHRCCHKLLEIRGVLHLQSNGLCKMRDVIIPVIDPQRLFHTTHQCYPNLFQCLRIYFFKCISDIVDELVKLLCGLPWLCKTTFRQHEFFSSSISFNVGKHEMNPF